MELPEGQLEESVEDTQYYARTIENVLEDNTIQQEEVLPDQQPH